MQIGEPEVLLIGERDRALLMSECDAVGMDAERVGGRPLVVDPCLLDLTGLLEVVCELASALVRSLRRPRLDRRA